MLPSLPQNDPSPGARRAALERARREWPLGRAYRASVRPTGNAVAARLPPGEDFSVPFGLRVGAVDARLLANHAAVDLEVLFGAPVREISGIGQARPTVADLLGITRMVGTRHQMFQQPFKAASRLARSFPPSVERYQETFSVIPKPPVVDKFDHRQDWNRLFAWYRVAGNNPFTLRAIRILRREGESESQLLSRAWPHLRRARYVHHDGIEAAQKAFDAAVDEAALHIAKHVGQGEHAVARAVEDAVGRIPFVGRALEGVVGDAQNVISHAMDRLKAYLSAHVERDEREAVQDLQPLAQKIRAEFEDMARDGTPFDRFLWWLLARHEPASGPPAGLPAPERPPIPFVLPDHFPVTDAIYRSVMGSDDSLEKAAGEGRLFMADYRLCDALPQGTYREGLAGVERPKFIYAPMALFAWRQATDDAMGELVPVAIQCHQSPWVYEDDGHGRLTRKSVPNPIFTPNDGPRWAMAMAVVQCADANHHEMVMHLGRSHMVMEAIYVIARRTLAVSHPLMVLIAQHCEFTLAINDYAVHHLIAPGGQVDMLFGSTLDGTLTIMARALQEFRLDRASPPDELAARGVDDVQGLPEYPYRDDALALWEPFSRWIDGYVRLYYGDASDVSEDDELGAFLSALSDPDGGNLQGVPKVDSVEELSKFVATVCWIGSGQHSALNYTQYPFMSYPPSMPLALYAEAPTEDTPQNLDNFAAMLAPASDALMQADISYQLSGVKWRRIGHYKSDAFEDPRVRPLLKRLHAEFEVVEAGARGRDRVRFLSYPYLFPSEAQNSIFI